MAEAPASAPAPLSPFTVPPFVKPYLEKAKPYLGHAKTAVKIATPHIVAAYNFALRLWVLAQPYHPEEFLPALGGLILLFFGGRYMTLIAAYEALRLSGWDRLHKCAHDLMENYKKAKEASDKDDEVDADGDGTADVNQISTEELFSRKAKLVFKVVDPEQVTDALTGIYACFVAVIATLKVRFAQAITLGVAIGEIFFKPADAYLRPILEANVPPEYQKWIRPGIRYGCKSLGISIAWFIQRVIFAFHSSVRGANLFVFGSLAYLARRGYCQSFDESTSMFAGLTVFVAAVGFFMQVTSGFGLPFPFWLFLFPIDFVEYLLVYFVGVK